jgi:hypothetical protein
LLLFEIKVQGKDVVVRFKDKVRYNVLRQGLSIRLNDNFPVKALMVIFKTEFKGVLRIRSEIEL